MKSNKVIFFVMTEKGYRSLETFIVSCGSEHIEQVVIGKDPFVKNDWSREIEQLCEKNKISHVVRGKERNLQSTYGIAVSWKWIIKDIENLVILHDSLLPKYRGFNPLVSCLLNGDTETGVTALIAQEEYDTGDIIEQKKIPIRYPMSINQLISDIIPAYQELIKLVGQQIIEGNKLKTTPQNEKEVVYSLWRDETDYSIDWTLPASSIKRFIDAVGDPYDYASATLNGRVIKITSAEEFPDVKIANRTAGKVIFTKDNFPVIVCTQGLLKITGGYFIDDKSSILPLTKFRSRFA